jgi:arylsulfatase A-like enzyme
MAHTYYPPYLWRDNRKEMLAGNPPYAYGQQGVIEPSGRVYSHDLVAADALDWVRRHKDGPFFLYLAFTIPHLSLQVPEDSLAEYRGKWPETPLTTSKHYANCAAPRAAYAAMISRMDRDVGRLMTTLAQLGLDRRTLVFFASDNGAVFPYEGTDPDFFRSNGNLRGYKQDLYEGGIRTPLIARWPGRIKAGTINNFVGAFWDLMPTLCELAGVSAPAAADIDGLSILPTLLGQPGQKSHEYLYWEYHSAGGAQAVRFGDWKAVRNNAKNAVGAPPELYNLASDPGEKTNLADHRPDLAARAASYMKAAHRPSAEPEWNF